jgi:hypothetical protein
MAFNVVHNAVTYTSNLAIPGLANTGAVYVTANGNSLIYDANGRIVVGGAGTVGLYDSSNTGIYFQKQTSASESNVPYIRAEGDSTTTHLALGPSSSSGTLRFYTGGYERARVDSAGNFGLGITPSSWTSSWKAIQIGSGSTYSMYGSGSIGFGIISNAYYNGSSYIYTNSTSTPAGLLDFNIASIGGWTWRIASANTAGNAVSFSNVMTLNNSGYLGIGATSPSTNLTIGGTAAGSGASGGLGVFLSRGNTTNFFEAYDSTKSFIAGVDNTQTFAKVGTLSSHDLGIVTGNSSKIYVKNSTGYVGIGTTNPTQLLEIAANSHSYAEVYLHNDDTTTGDFGTQAMFRLGAGGNPIGSLKTTVNPLGGLSTQALYLTTEGSYPIAFGINNSATPSMILDTSGNLGLGVTPSSWSTGRAMEFSVVGNSIWGYNGEMIIGNNIAGYGSGNFKYGQSAAASYYGMQLGQHQWYVAPSGNANSTISFTQAMTLDNSGNLMIGTTTPVTQLTLYKSSGSVGLATQSGSTYGYFINDGTYAWMGSNQGSTGKKFLVALAAPDNAAIIDSSGNLLVNYDASSFSYHTGKLSVFTGTGGADELYFIGDKASQSQNSNSPRINLVGRYQTAGVGIQAVNTQSYGGKDLVITMHNASDYTTYYEAMRLTSSGRLGIGVSSPGYALDVNGSANVYGTVYSTNLYIGPNATSYGNNAPYGIQIGQTSSLTGTYNPYIFYNNAYGTTGSNVYPQFVGNWASSSYYGIGPDTISNDSTVRIGVVAVSAGNGASWFGYANLKINKLTSYNTASTVINNGSHLQLENPSGTQASIGFTYSGVVKGMMRVDNVGNMVLNANSSNFYFNYDLGSTSVNFITGTTQFLQATTTNINLYLPIISQNANTYVGLYSRYNGSANGVFLFNNGTGVNSTFYEAASNFIALGYNSGAVGSSPPVPVIQYNNNTALGNGGVVVGGGSPDTAGASGSVLFKAQITNSNSYGASARGIACVNTSGSSAYGAVYVSATNPGFDWQFGKGALDASTDFGWCGNGGGTALMRLTSAGNLTVAGALAKGSGSFVIEHPLPALSETHNLVHSFIEGPNADLIYRGEINLVNGKAQVNIDSAGRMTGGTFELLCRRVQCFTTNETDWTPVRGKVTGNILNIEAQDSTSNSTISWMVIGERKDKHMYDTKWTDEEGRVIVEPLKTHHDYDPKEDPWHDDFAGPPELKKTKEPFI